jgi:glycosyltransferase involved in cell wall biosynthesis
MKKKIFFVLSSFKAGGAERVFWLLSQSIDKKLYDVSIVLLNSNDSFFSTNLPGVRIIDLKTIRASRSFFKLLQVFKKERPDTVFTTGGQINILVGLISLAVKIPNIIARPTNQDNSNFISLKGKLYGIFSKSVYNRFDKVICQSEEIKEYLKEKQGIAEERLTVIPNPVLFPDIKRKAIIDSKIKRLIVVARLTPQKGITRLLDIFKDLPENYYLSIVGDGPLKENIASQIVDLNLSSRVKMLGIIKNVLEVVSEHDLFVLPSFIEGFPNVVIESLSVGTPVVSFTVGGISEILINDFNGYILKQGDLSGYRNKVIAACEKIWDSQAIQEDIQKRFSLESITKSYEDLII